MTEYRKVEIPDVFQGGIEKSPLKVKTLKEDPKILEEGGIEAWYEGDAFPTKGYPFVEMVPDGPVRRVAIAKRALMSFLKIIEIRPIRYFLPLFFLSDKVVWTAIECFVGFAKKVLEDFYLRPMNFCKSGREIYRMGIMIRNEQTETKKKEIIDELIMIVCTIWEFEFAYRYMGQDIASELDVEKLRKNPVKEISRLFDILIERSHPGREKSKIKKRWRAIKTVVMIYCWVKKSRLKKLIDLIDWFQLDKIKLDEADWYHCCNRLNYNFRGMSYEERKALKEKIDREYKIKQDFNIL